MKKVIFTVLLALTIVAAVPIKAKAGANVTYVAEIEGTTYNLQSFGYSNGVLIRTYNMGYVYFLCNSQFTIQKIAPYKRAYLKSVDNSTIYYTFGSLSEISSADISSYGTNPDELYATIEFKGDGPYYNNNTLYYFGELPAPYNDGQYDWSFQTCSLLKRAYLLRPVAQAVESKAIMKEIVGCLPLAIGFLVLVIGFYKAWKFLVKLLRTA